MKTFLFWSAVSLSTLFGWFLGSRSILKAADIPQTFQTLQTECEHWVSGNADIHWFTTDKCTQRVTSR